MSIVACFNMCPFPLFWHEASKTLRCFNIPHIIAWTNIYIAPNNSTVRCSLYYNSFHLKLWSTQKAQTSLAEADHYSGITHYIMCMQGCEAAKGQQCYNALHCLGGERITPKVLDHYLHHDLVMLQLLCFLLIYSLYGPHEDSCSYSHVIPLLGLNNRVIPEWVLRIMSRGSIASQCKNSIILPFGQLRQWVKTQKKQSRKNGNHPSLISQSFSHTIHFHAPPRPVLYFFVLHPPLTLKYINLRGYWKSKIYWN